VYSKDPVNGNYLLVKNVSLYQNYFTGGERLRLDSLKVTGSISTNDKITHKFSYNSMPLPGRLSFQRDWWGYYNGAAGNANLIPPVHIQEGTGYFDFFTSNNREVNPYYTQAGILNRIDYPTGGYTEFEYEPNKYQDGTGEKLAGGLRIKQIRSFTDAGIPAFKKTLVYPYGQVNIGPGFSYLNQVQTITRFVELFGGPPDAPLCPPLGGWESIVLNSVSANPVISMTDYDGNSIFYNNVTEYDGDAVTNNGNTEYNYNNFSDNVVNYVPPGKTFKENNLWRRSQLLSKYVRDKNNVLLNSVVNTYTDVQNTLFQDAGLLVGTGFQAHAYSCVGIPSNCGYPSCTPSSLVPKYNITNYAIRTGLRKLLSTTEYTYNQTNPANSLTKTINYTYSPSNNEPSLVTTTNSKGETISLNSVYASDYILLPVTGSNEVEGIKNLKNNNIITTPVEVYLQVQAPGSPVKTTAANISQFDPLSPLQTESFFLESRLPLTDFTPSVVNATVLSKDARYASRLKFLLYDSRNNLLQQQKTNDVLTSYIWDYLSAYPVAEVQSAAYSDIAYTSFEADGKGNWTYTGTPVADATAPTGKVAYTLNGSNNITKTGLNTATTYTVSYWTKNAGAFAISGTIANYPISGRSLNGWTYYEHKITGQSTVTISGSGSIDELRLYPEKALMTSYTYAPLIGMTTQCDANNRISYYEYDAFNRLSLIRDQDNNILKKFCYNYAGQQIDCNGNSTAPNWQIIAGSAQCIPCPANNNYNTGEQQHQEKDLNSYSSTYNQIRTVNEGPNANCSVEAWQNTATPVRCQYGSSGNTGYQEQEQIDMNPCSSTYNTTRWLQTGYNPTACPVACTYTMASGYSLLSNGLTNAAGNVSGYMVFYSTYSSVSPGGTLYNIAQISSGCVPTATRIFTVTSGANTWQVTVTPTGYISLYMISGPTVNMFNTIYISLNYLQ
jgi:hypothetical protein